MVSENTPVTDANKMTTRGIATNCKDGSMTPVVVEAIKDHPDMNMEESKVDACPAGTKNVFLTTGAGVLWDCDYGPDGRTCMHYGDGKPCTKNAACSKLAKEANLECKQGKCMCKTGYCMPRRPKHLKDWTDVCEKTTELNAGLQLMKYLVLDPKHYTDEIPYYTVDETGPKGQDHPDATGTETVYGVIDPLEIHPYRRTEDVTGGKNLVAKRPQEGFRGFNPHAKEQLDTAEDIRKHGGASKWAKDYPEYNGAWGERTKGYHIDIDGTGKRSKARSLP